LTSRADDPIIWGASPARNTVIVKERPLTQNALLFKIGLSLWGAVSLAVFGVIVGLVWGSALGVGALGGAIGVGCVAAVWGAVCFQLTPTGGVILDNKVTVNYAVIALHGWLAALLSLIGLIVWGIRVAVS
jgi:hypothetical protein